MLHFKYCILIPKEDKDVARIWCIKEFGNIPISRNHFIKLRNKKTGREYNKYVGRTYNKIDARWINWVGGRNNSRAFYFKGDIDAMAFKLRWMSWE